MKLFEIAYKKMAADRESSGSSDAESKSEDEKKDEKKADSN